MRRHIEPGTQYGDLAVICETHPTKGNNRRFLCKCACDNPTVVYMSNLHLGKTTSCGCRKLISLPEGRETVIRNRLLKAQASEAGRLCSTCDEWKPWTAFSRRNGQTACGYASNCKECAGWRSMLATFGITKVQWHELNESRGGVCVLCGETDSGRRLCVDHDHSHCGPTRGCPQCIRGLLCIGCNTMLGHAEHKPGLLRLLAPLKSYLKRRPLLHLSQKAI